MLYLHLGGNLKSFILLCRSYNSLFILYIINRRLENSKGNKREPEKVATSRTEDGHKWNTNTSTTI
jgi:hypothetical protein